MNALLIVLAMVSADVTLHPCETDLIQRVNVERTSRGLVALVLEPGLLISARNHCIWMSQSSRMVHSGGVAENIAMGQADSGQVMRSWMNSSGHRANILNPRYRSIGVAGFLSPRGTPFWCQQFR
jgi:uncharacterized protein YkwD